MGKGKSGGGGELGLLGGAAAQLIRWRGGAYGEHRAVVGATWSSPHRAVQRKKKNRGTGVKRYRAPGWLPGPVRAAREREGGGLRLGQEKKTARDPLCLFFSA
jgi:hypothetical protein